MRGLRFLFLFLTIGWLGGALGGSLGLAHAAEPAPTQQPDLKTMATAVIDAQSPRVTSADAPDAERLAALVTQLNDLRDGRVKMLLQRFTPDEIAYMYAFYQTPAGKSIGQKKAKWFYDATMGPNASLDALVISACDGIGRPH